MLLGGARGPALIETEAITAQQRALFQDPTPGARGASKDLADQVVQQFCNEHPERYLLAFVYRYLGDHDLLRARTAVE